jgi:hypothetical protein
MARSYRKNPSPTAPGWGNSFSDWSARERAAYLEDVNPPNSFRRMWRRLHRARTKRAMIRTNRGEDLQVPTKLSHTTSIYDWY